MCDLSLQWNDHSSTFLGFVSSLLEKNRFSDATIACNGQLYPVHKFVLSVCSSYFNSIFEDTTSTQHHPFLILKDISQDVLEALLKFMYIGQVSIQQEKIVDFISAAKSLKIKGLDVNDAQNKSGDGEENDFQVQESSISRGLDSNTTENELIQGSFSNQNHLIDSSPAENTASLATQEEVNLTSVGTHQDASNARQGSGKAKRGRPAFSSGKRYRSQGDSSPGFPPAKKSSQDQSRQAGLFPIPDAITAPPHLNGPEFLGFDDTSIAPVKQELVPGVPLPQLVEEDPLSVVVEVAKDPSFPSVQQPLACQQQQAAEQNKSVAESPSSSLRSFRLTDRPSETGQQQESRNRLADIGIVPEDRLSKSVVPSNTSSLPKIRVISEDKLLPPKTKLSDVRIVPKSRLGGSSLASVHPGSKVPHTWTNHSGESSTLQQSRREPSPNSSSVLPVPIITSCYSELPPILEPSPSTSTAPEQFHPPPPPPPLRPVNSVDPGCSWPSVPPQISVSETSSQVLQSPLLALALEGVMAIPSPVKPCSVQVNPSPVKACSVKLKRISPNKSDSVSEESLGKTQKSSKMLDVLEHTKNSRFQARQLTGSVSVQDSNDKSKSKGSAYAADSEVLPGDNIEDTSATKSDKNVAHLGHVNKCEICYAEFEKRTCLAEHQKSHDESRKYFKCSHCQYITTSSTRLRQHMENQKGNILSKCKYCTYTACSERLITFHQSCVFTKKEKKKPDSDEHVDKKSYKKRVLQTSKAKFSCSTCHEIFPTRLKLERHKSETCSQGGFNSFKCDFCQFKSSSQGILKNHMLTHSTKARFTCFLCSYSSDVERALRKHLIYDHKITETASVSVEPVSSELESPLPKETVAGSKVLECDADEPSDDESENSTELGLSFNVEEFQKECSIKLQSNKDANLLSNMAKHEKRKLTLEAKCVEIPENASLKLGEASSSACSLMETKKQVDLGSHQFKHKLKKKNETLNTPLVQAVTSELLDNPVPQDQLSEALNLPLAHQKLDSELLSIPLSEQDQKNEAVDLPVEQNGLNRQEDNLQSKGESED